MAAEKTLEQLDKLGESSISLLNDFATKGVDFIMEQTPDVCNQIINRSIILYCFNLFVYAGIGLLFAIFSKRLHAWWIKNQDDVSNEHPSIVFSWVFYICAIFIGIVPTSCFIYNILYVWSAPKVYLIEYFTKLIKGF